MTVGMPSHMSIDSALRRAGLLKVSQPIAPSFSAINFSVGDLIITYSLRDYFVLAQRSDVIAAVARFRKHHIGMLAMLRCRHAQFPRRAAEAHRLADHFHRAALF